MRKTTSEKNGTTYHFCCLKSSIILHMNDEDNSSVQSTIRKLRHEILVKVFIYLNRNSLHSRKECPHVLYYRLTFGKKKKMIPLKSSDTSSQPGM